MHRFSKSIPSDGCLWVKTMASYPIGAVGFSNTTGLPETEASSPMPAEVGSVCSGGEVFFFLNDKAPP